MKVRYIFTLITLVSLSGLSMAQVDRKFNREAMRAMEDGNYNEAIINFQKAMKENPEDAGYVNNLGHAHYRNENYENAAQDYAMYADKMGLSKSEQFYNLGNAFLQAGDYDKGIKSYIQSLKMDPEDEETKYNLSMAHAMKRQQEQRQQQQQQNQDQNQDENQDQNKDKQKQNQDQQDQEDNQDKQEQQQSQPQEQEMSREDAERMLQALQKKEEDLQDKQKKKAKAYSSQPEKDW